MAEEMSKEDQYKLAMIVLAGVCGALLIAVLITVCCCVKYQRKLYGSGKRVQRTTLSRLSYGDPHCPMDTTYETYPTIAAYEPSHAYQDPGINHHVNTGPGSVYCSPIPPAPPKTSGGCRSMMTPGMATSSPYSMGSTPQCKPVKNEYGRVLLNPPSAVCTKPAMPSAQLGGHCGTGGGCDGKFFSMQTGQPVASTGSQFVLESGSATKY